MALTGVTLTERAFLDLQHQVRRMGAQVARTQPRQRAVRIHLPQGGGAYRWARTRTGGIAAATYDPTGGSESLGAMTPGSALCDILVSAKNGPLYEIQADKEETIFNGVLSTIAGDTIIGIIKHQDGRQFVIVEDCPPIEACPPCIQVPARVIHAIIGSVTSGTCSTPECNVIQDTFGLVLNTQCGWSSTALTLACVGDFKVEFQISDIGGGDVSLRLQLSTTGPPAEQAIWEITPVDLTMIDCSTGTIANFAAGNLVSNTWTLCDMTATTIQVVMSPAP